MIPGVTAVGGVAGAAEDNKLFAISYSPVAEFLAMLAPPPANAPIPPVAIKSGRLISKKGAY